MSAPNKPTAQVMIAIVLGAALVLGAAAWWWQARVLNARLVQVEVAAISETTRLLAVNGKIAPLNAVAMRVSVTGTVLQVLAKEGDVVARGAVLATLDPGIQVASVVQAQTALAQGQMRAAQAADSYARDAKLRQLTSPTALEASRQDAASAAQDVLRLDALLTQATIQLGRFALKAPMRGTVITAAVDMGQLVDPSSPLFTLADLSALVVEASVDETYASQIEKGQTAMLQLIGTRAVLAGKVAFVAPRVDGATGGLGVKLAFDTPVQAPVGLTVTANILVDKRAALTVPRSALQGGGVFLLQNGTAHWAEVSTIEWPADRLIVTKGIKAGDVVIVTAEGVSEGQRAAAMASAN